MVQKDGRIILGYRRLEEWFYRDLKRKSKWLEEVIFGWLKLLYPEDGRMFLRKFKENVLKGRKYHSFHRNPSYQLPYVMFGRAGTLMNWLVNVSCGMNINLCLHIPRNLCDGIFHWCRWLGISMSRYFDELSI